VKNLFADRRSRRIPAIVEI